MKKFGLAVFLSVSVIIVYFVAGARLEPSSGGSDVEQNSPDPNEKAAPLSGPALDGKTIALSDFAGKVVLVDFWATWCDPCREEIPDLVKLRDKLKDKGFEIFGVSMDENGAKAVKKYIAKQPISYPVALNGGERPPEGWDVPGLPTAYLIGRNGQVLKRWFGEKDMPELERDVTAALANKLAAALLFAALAAPAAAASVDLFPRPNEIFPLLIADPRHIQVGASYYRLEGRNTSDIALGHSWGITRWRTGSLQDWLWESDVEGMAYSRFTIGGGVNEFETVDFFANLPVTVRRGDVSFKGTLFHESSHLGDDYIRRTGDRGFRSSSEGVRLQAALEPRRWGRLYAGGTYLLHQVPAVGASALQGGLEFFSDDMNWAKRARARLFVGQDFQWHQDVRWNMDSHTVAGLKLSSRESSSRAMRFQLGYFNGHSPFGQFYTRRTHYADVSIVFEL